MRKSASRLEEPSSLGELLREGLVLTGAAILSRPALVGGTTAFLVATAFVSANALWYQPYQHTGAFFTTRAVIERHPAAAAEPQAASPQPGPAPQRFDVQPAASRPTAETTASLPAGDLDVALVQQVLKRLELYDGEVDGLAGPRTAAAVEHYQRLVGIAATGRIDAVLLSQLGVEGTSPVAGNASDTAAEPEVAGSAASPALAIPASAPLPQPRPETDARIIQAAYRAPDPTVMRIQAGLKAFGNDAIELDGVVGARTRAAIREFQSLFGLQVTGEPDAAVYAKMREIGLTN